jgi:EmrB/QacA subfamily drug resistance transporter
MSAGDATAGRPRQSTPLIMAGLVTASMAFALMQTFLIPALPRLQEDLGASTTWVTWTVTAYLLTGSVATPLMGKLGDQHGKVRLMLIALAVFLAGSIGAIVAWNVGSLIAFRAVQGVGGAVFPLSFAIIRDEFPPERVGVAMGLVSAVLGIGGGLGIVASGVIVDHASWRWLFVVSAVIVAIALVLVWRFVPESPVKHPSRLDLPGALLLSGGLVCLLVGLTEGQSLGWGSAPIVGLFAGSAVFFLAWGRVETRVAQPMVDMRMLARRAVLFTNLTALLSGFALYMTWVILPAFYQFPHGLPAGIGDRAGYGFGTSVTVAGAWMLPTSASVVLAGPVAGLLGRRYGSRGPLVAGMLLMALGFAGIALWHDAPWKPAVAFTLCGVGVGFAFAVMPKLIVDAVDRSETGVATGMNTVVRTVGGVVGAQVGAVLLASHTLSGTSVPAESGFVAAFWVSVIGALVGAVAASLVFPRRPGRRAPATAAPDGAEPAVRPLPAVRGHR